MLDPKQVRQFMEELTIGLARVTPLILEFEQLFRGEKRSPFMLPAREGQLLIWSGVDLVWMRSKTEVGPLTSARLIDRQEALVLLADLLEGPRKA